MKRSSNFVYVYCTHIKWISIKFSVLFESLPVWHSYMKIIVFALSTCAGQTWSTVSSLNLTWVELTQRTEYIMAHEWQDESSCRCSNAAAYAVLVSGVALIETLWLLRFCIVICYYRSVFAVRWPIRIQKRKLDHSANRSLKITLRQFSLMAFLLPLSKSIFNCSDFHIYVKQDN